MAKTLGDVRTEVLYRLGDSTSSIWSAADINRYLNEGYEQFTVRTAVLWDLTYLEDQAYTGSHTAAWEPEFFEAGNIEHNLFHYTANWEADYAFDNQLSLGPANHTAFWEYDYDYHSATYCLAVHTLPEELIEIERAVWNKRRIEPLRSNELESSDAQYQTEQGEVMGYIRDKDGIRSFRKWRIPSAPADEYTVTGGWGILRDPSDIADEAVLGTWGVPRRIPGEFACGDRGIPRRVWKAAHNTKIEFTRKGAKLVFDEDEFELPDLHVKYIRHFAMYRALDRNGKGQDVELATFWRGLWEAGIQRSIRRKRATMATRTNVLGGEFTEDRRPPLARLPWQYGRVVR